jgi:hypothetical protein
MDQIALECDEMWAAIHLLKRQKTLPAIRQARQLLRTWLEMHPADVASRDAGEELAMLEEAHEIIAQEHLAEPAAA